MRMQVSISKSIFSRYCFASWAWLVILSSSVFAEDPSADRFERHIEPLLRGHCLKCHNPADKQAGFDLTTRQKALAGGESGAVIKPGMPDDSLLLQRVRDGEMPPEEKLTAEEIAHLAEWIKSGAAFSHDIKFEIRRAGKDFWALKKPARPALPTVSNPGWCRNPIDYFVSAKLAEHKLAPSPETDRRSYLRRVKFDLLGLPPTMEELRAFEADKAPDAYEKLVDGFLMSPHYGERWGRHWLDVVRFGESHGYETNLLRFNAWPYRDYVIRSINEDKPYPQFILEQLAGDVVAAGQPDVEVATAFLVAGTHDLVGNQTLEGTLKQRNDDLDDMISTTGFAFLGLTLGCARCHDHKFDPITQKDYYGLQAIFAGVQHAERAVSKPDSPQQQQEATEIQRQLAELDRQLDGFEPLANTTLVTTDPANNTPRRPAVQTRRNVERFAPVMAKFVRFTIKATSGNSQPCLDELEVFSSEAAPHNVALATLGVKPSASSSLPGYPIHQIAHLNEGLFGNSNSWISNEAGQGWVQLEFPQPQLIERIVWGRDREEKFKDRLPTEYVIEVALEASQWQTVASSADRIGMGVPQPAAPRAETANDPKSVEHQQLVKRRETLTTRLVEITRPVTVYAGTFMQPGPTNLLLRGDGLLKGPEVPPSMVRAFGGEALDKNLPERERRVALAKWIGSENHPLTARVLVNRLWHYHFGQGLVNTPNDFGFNGGRPSHPELLDWLATEFMADGWKPKALHRLIVLSATYRQATQTRADGIAADAGNRLLWRFPPRRLEAETIRDTVLATSGKLDLRMGGPGYNIWEKNTNYVVVFKHKPELGADEFRRMVYQFKPRAQLDQTFGVFDCPDGSFSMPRRFASTTVLQALNLLNGGFVLQQAEHFAARLQAEVKADPTAQVQRAFEIAFLREPTATESAAAVSLIKTHGLSAFCRAILNSNELIYLN
ncbi:MAG: hypothetical protein JWM11_2451 [Planctomycetaceae bacterium]|nr:hypothetical protein [Planctomycetaceae bacterium]